MVMGTPLRPLKDRLPRHIKPGAIYANIDPRKPRLDLSTVPRRSRVIFVYDGANDAELDAFTATAVWGSKYEIVVLGHDNLDHIPRDTTGELQTLCGLLSRRRAYRQGEDGRWAPTKKLMDAVRASVDGYGDDCGEIRVRRDKPRLVPAAA
jgi:hypothetical protein